MPRSTDRLIVMARAPRIGTVKSRLAATLGTARALSIYRGMAEQTIAMARGTALPVSIAFTPPDAAAEMHRWLGDDLHYAPQADGDLGARMATAISAHLAAGATRVVVIGTDCPGLTAATVHDALAALDSADVVYGPSTDGGYYLVAVRAAHDVLFRDVPWSSTRTLATSLEHAADAALRVALLQQLRDVDTEDDWHWHVQQSAVPT